MQTKVIVGFAALASACSLGGASVDAPGAKHPLHVVEGDFGLVPPEKGSTTYLQDPIEDPAVPPPIPPRNVVCTIAGTDAPFDSSCTPRQIAVSSDAAGKLSLARFEPQSAEITWGVVEGRATRSWVDVRADGWILTGYADTKNEKFSLKRDVAIIPERVWFNIGAPVLIQRGTKDGIHVSVIDEVAGVSDIDARVSCADIAYAWPDFTAPDASMPRPTPTGAEIYASPARARLPIVAEPGGQSIATLGNGVELLLSLEVVEQKQRWSRVRFETGAARFDVWVDSNELAPDKGMLGHGVGTGGCGGIAGGSHEEWITTQEAVKVRIGKTPFSNSPEGLVLARGTTVRVLSRKKRFVEVEATQGRILAPTGASFWVPESAFEHPE